MVSFVKDLLILLTDGDYPDVDHSADGIRVTFKPYAKSPMSMAFQPDSCWGSRPVTNASLMRGKRFCLLLTLNVNPFEVKQIVNGYFAEHE